MQEKYKLTSSLEDYLEAMYQIILEKQGVKAIDVSKRLNVKRSSVTEALKNLSSKGLVNYGRYEVISLTDEGKKAARRIIKKHNTLYDFFNHVLGLSPEESTDNACKMEHSISDKALSRLIDFMEFCKNKETQNPNFLSDFLKKSK
ncbi:MAG: metal-dependent transcriptional regulator [Candidatus Gastranaerophilales bacterium]|nr:metal-dependent transcriptional regulator [Candidatus Gastranaerophilales bacterium]